MSRKSILNLKLPQKLLFSTDTVNNYGVFFAKTETSQKHFPLHNHNYFEIEYLISGRIIQNINGTEIESTAGSFHCLDQYDIHSFDIKECFKINNIRIDFRKIPSSTLKLLHSIPFPYVGKFSKEQLKKVNEWFKIVYALQSTNEDYAAETVYSYITLIIIECLKSGKTLSTTDKKTQYHYVKSSVGYIELNYKNHITLEDVAKQLNITSNYLSQIFPKYSGCSFIEYLNSYRVEQAKNLIINTDLSLTEIALNTGFGSLCSFSRAFNKYEGYSAREFKQKYKNPDSI